MAWQGGLQGVSLPAYSAPDQFAAREAFNDLVTEFVLAGRDGFSLSTSVDNDPYWAQDFELLRCVWGQEVNLDYIGQGLLDNNGYFCRFMVQQNEGPAYSTVGFFAHDGAVWRYFSRIKPSDEARRAKLPDDKIARAQPYVVSPYLDGQYYNYDFTYGRQTDNTPYVGATEGFYSIDPYSQKARGFTDQVISVYERDDYRRRRDMEGYVQFPKGSKERNKTGY